MPRPSAGAASPPGVYVLDAGDAPRLIHEWTEGEYRLHDVIECFGLGRDVPAPPGVDAAIEIDAADLDRLKVLTDAYSFDYEEGFIEMCVEMWRRRPAAGACRFGAIE